MKEAIIELYLNVKIRNPEDDSVCTDDLDIEREKLKELDEFTVLDYIRSSIEILMNLKIEEHEGDGEPQRSKLKVPKEESQTDYEETIQKLEADVRNHISVEQQLKLYVESYQ